MTTVTAGRVPLGAGGQLTGISIASDGRKCVRTDVYNGYWWDATDLKWQFLFDKPSIGSYVQSPVNELATGMWEVAVAENVPSALNRVYAMLHGGLWVRDGVAHGTSSTWTKTSMANYDNGLCDPNFSYKFTGQHIAVDPNNQNVLYVATPTNGVQRSLNGGSTWAAVAGITMDSYFGGGGLAIDGGSGTTTLSGVTVSKNIMIPSVTHGAWASTDGGASFTQVANGSSSPLNVWKGRFGVDGVYWCTEYTWSANPSFPVWKYVFGSGWTNITLANLANTLAVVPTGTAGHVLFIYEAARTGYETLDNGATLVGSGGNFQWQNSFPPPGVGILATDILWLNSEGNFSTGDVMHDLSDGYQYCGEGVGVWKAQWPTTYNPFTWVSQSIGIEELVANDMVQPPGYTDPFFANSDRGIMHIANAMTTYPSTYYPNAGYLFHGWNVDYASSDPTFVHAINNFFSYFAGYTTDGVTWNVFPDQSPANGGGEFLGGSMAFQSPSVGVWIPAENRQQVYYTTNGGTNWSAVGASLPNAGWPPQTFNYGHILCAGKGTDHRFYAYNYASSGSIYSSPDGINWTQVYVGTPGGGGSAPSLARIRCPWTYVGGYDTTGHVWFCGGAAYGAGLAYSTDYGVNWTTLSTITQLQHFAFGKPRSVSPSSYPVIYAAGSIDGGATIGLHMSEDMGATWVTLSAGRNNPLGTLDQLWFVGANENAFGRAYLGYEGSAWIYVDVTSSAAGRDDRILGLASAEW